MHPRNPATSRFRWLVLTAFLLGVAAGGWYVFGRSQPAIGRDANPGGNGDTAVRVEVAAPKLGGIDRICVQPGTIEPFESADLYAKVSGFLLERRVDIGSHVKEGDVLAKISVPEYEKQVEKDTAEVRRAEAKVVQMKAAVQSAEADLRSATALVALSQAEQKSKTSYRSYRQKQRERIKGLFAQQAIDAKLVDEQEDQYEAAFSAELAAGEAVNAAKQKEAAARSKVDQAKADEKYADAEVAVAKAMLDKSTVLLGYTLIKSPYTGVVTHRNFNRGDFIRSADAGGERVPLLSVERTETMRVIVQVPDRDVPYVNVGDPAVIEIDALPGTVLQTTSAHNVEVSRTSDSEDPHTRTMRTEIDVLNPEGKLRRGMYGNVTLMLNVGATNAVRVPSGAIVKRGDAGKGAVRVVRDGHIATVPVTVGTDNGVEAEVLKGLTTADKVVVRTTTTVEDGAAVTTSEAKPQAAGH
ncbi:efflux RND transporter periplasmic adaptor subunit [Limnoglobus roseus]|uniref:Efflux RND transporter periplasmic adaptor subunit n=1 Tax=Limnoglobus roseus TaxID=2598579 RepID=A0A5C1AM08_9BACT|nr:efflux RND transporter periplasmic adaptor subunit [Limnoglobus roseus]QEL19605.1 efflux RND transporter periplasmic adaptor subunit [Limnoglobus roseus]